MPKDKYSIELEVRKIGEGLEQVKREMHELGNQVKTEGAKIRAETGHIDQGFKKVSSAISSVKTMIIGLGAIVAVKKLAGDFLDTARAVERMQIQLRVLLGSAERGGELFEKLTKFAREVPFELRKVMEAATMLAGIVKGGIKDIMAWLPLIADLAAAQAIDLQIVTAQVMRMLSSGAASADLFREKGILAFLGFQAGVTYSAEETRKKLWESWASAESRFRGATELMKKSWDGMISMLHDAWFQFMKDVMEAGVFDRMKAGIELVLRKIDDLKEKGKLDKWAKEMAGDVVIALKGVAYAAAAVGDAFRGWEIILLGIQGLTYMIAHQASMWLADLFIQINKIPGLKGRFESMIADLLHDAERAFGKLAEIEGKLIGMPEANLLRMRKLFKEIEGEIGKLGTTGAGARAAPGLVPPGGPSATEEWTEEMLRAEALVGPWLQDRYDYELDYADAIRETNKLLKEQEEKVLPALRKELEAQAEVLEDFYNVTDTQLQDIKVRHRDTTDQVGGFWKDMSDDIQWSLEAGLFDLFKNGFKDMESAAKQFLEMLVQSFARAVAKMIAEWLVFKAITTIGSFFGGGTGGMEWGGMYQHGGWIREPIMGVGQSGRRYLFGEAGPEAVVPAGAFAARRDMTQNIYIVDDREKVPGLTDNDVILVVSDDIQNDGVIRKTIKRFA